MDAGTPSFDAAKPISVIEVVSRYVGGAAHQVITLASLLDSRGYDTLVVRGVAGADEVVVDHLAERLGVRSVQLRTLRRPLGPGDLRALRDMRALIRRTRPDLLHSHAAKGGAIGRLAALLAGRSRPRVLVHSFHGHVLGGELSPWLTALYRAIERWLARRTAAIVVPAAEVADELVGIGIAPADRFAVIPLGVDLSPFQVAPDRAAELREQVRGQLGIEDGARVATLVARLAPEKRVDRFLRVAERLLEVERARFLVVGDGALREQLQRSAPARALGARLVWAGQRTDMPAIYCASDVVALSSDREGAPVSLIEAQAAGVPVVSTDVGGVQRVVAAAHSGLLVARDDEPGFAAALAGLLEDADAARRLGENGRIHAARAFSLDRLADDVDRLYRRLLSGAAPG